MKVLVNTKSKEDLIKEISKEDFQRKTLSFYKYVNISNPKQLRDELFKKLESLNCRGRIYVSSEGINAQMNVPQHLFADFDSYIQSIPEFFGTPYKIAVEEKGKSSFLKLVIKVKNKIVADGIEDPSFDPSNTGEYVTAEEVNEAIGRGVTIVDMRNAYEAEVGHFQNAQIMDVDTFREQIATVENQFKDKKEEEVILYCTGGIRCEKASAWMKYRGFKNVKHIKGGVIDYAHQVKEKKLPNMFLGKNFVFDERLGERIGDEIISKCHLCQNVKCDDHTHCKNQMCHMLFIGCKDCLEKTKGYCSLRCSVFDKAPKSLNQFFVGRVRKPHDKQFKKNYWRNSKIKS